MKTPNYNLRFFGCLILSVLLFGCVSARATTYYVDSASGNDTYNGTSTSTPWLTLTKVTSTTFSAGDRILLKKGGSWLSQQLWPKGSGTSGNPITIDCYGAGAQPHLDSQNTLDNEGATIYLYNQEFFDINNLDIGSYYSSSSTKAKAGIYVKIQDIGVKSHFHLTNLTVHGVDGNNENKETGGIIFRTRRNDDSQYWVESNFNDVLIEDCYIYDCNRSGISKASGWDTRSFSDNGEFVPDTNIIVRNNIFEDCGGHGFVWRVAESPLFEYNTLIHNGKMISTNAMMFFSDDNAIAQYNECYNQDWQVGETDGTAFDADYNCKNTLFQYNYAHENGEAAFTMPCSGSDPCNFNVGTIFRYNISQNNPQETFHISGPCKNSSFYNNTIYLGTGISNNLIVYSKSWGGYADNTSWYNNIIYNLSSNAGYDFTSSTNNTFDYNVFYGNHPTSEPSDAHKLTSDPLLASPGSGGIGLSNVAGYKIQAGSPCRDSGKTIANNGGKDYWGNTVPSGDAADRGANEYVAILDGNDHTAPTPNPMTWSSNPAPASTSSITMTASTATDPNGTAVQYYFDCVTAGGHDSSWQTSTTYVDTGLSASTSYTYQVKARDTSPNYNETTYSTQKSATTNATPVDVNFAATADTYVKQNEGDTNFGTATNIRVRTDATGEMRGYYKFVVSGVGPIVSAKLRIYSLDAMDNSKVKAVTGTWAENTLTWNNDTLTWNPTAADTITPISANTWYEFDVSSIVTGDGTYTIGIKTDDIDSGLDWCSRESAYAPVLKVQYTPVPTFVAAGAVASGTGTITPALPSGIATNDILLLFLETSNQAISISNQNGGTWTQVTNSPQYCGTAAGSTGARLTAFWSRYNGTQGAPTASDSGDHQLGRIIAIRHAASSGDPWDVTAGGTEATADTSGSIPGATTTVANTLVVVAIAASLPDASGTANFSSWTNANLTSVTEQTDNTVTAGNGGGLGVATGRKAASGAYGNTAVTLGSSAYKGMMSIAIKP